MDARDLILPSFVADALALGPHWIYDAEEIRSHYPSGISDYDAPRSSYHGDKIAGDFTHTGDQTLALLQSVAQSGWSMAAWRNDWLHWVKHTKAYIDGASKRTLENLEAGLEHPSDSSDLAGASRLAPLFAVLEGPDLIEAARAQTALTHGDPQVIDAAEFFTRAASLIQDGANFGEAFDGAASHPYDSLPAIEWVALSRQAAESPLADAGKSLGLACGIAQAFPLTLVLALKLGEQPVEALVQNALLGGDSAARGLLLGLLLGARHGVSAFPESWLTGLNAGKEIEEHLAKLT